LQNFFANGIENIWITTRIISSAYLANFYFTGLQDYNKASALCDQVVYFLHTCGGLDSNFSERAFPIFITNEISLIYDENFQTVFGLVTLHRFIFDSLQNKSTVLVRIRPAQLRKYLKMQCKRREGVDEPENNENFEPNGVLYLWYDTYEPLSGVFMSAVMHAGRRKVA